MVKEVFLDDAVIRSRTQSEKRAKRLFDSFEVSRVTKYDLKFSLFLVLRSHCSLITLVYFIIIFIITMSDQGTSVVPDTDESTKPATKKRVRRKAFCLSWLDEPKFQPWLARCEENEGRAKCLICNKTLRAGKSELVKHSVTQPHLAFLQRMKVETSTAPVSLTFSDKVKRAEIAYVLDVIENNMSFHSVNDSDKMTNRVQCDSDILSKITLKRTKIAAIVKNVINKYIVNKVTTILKNCPFSILVDISTDVLDNKNLCILARYVYQGKIQTYLIDYFRVEDWMADYLYKCFQNSMEKYKLPISNVVGICVNNADVMIGRHSFVSRLLIDTKKEIAVFPCIYHSMQLISCDACERLPKRVEKLLDALYDYFNKNDKKLGGLEEVQEIMEQLKMFQPTETRWLALIQTVGKVVKEWNALYGVFAAKVIQNVVPVDNSTTALFDHVNCLYTKAYLHFLNYNIKLFDEFNTIFQTNEVLIHRFMSECVRFLRTLASNFMRPQIVHGDDLPLIDPYNVDNLLPLESINISPEAKEIIQELKHSKSDDENVKITEFFKSCQEFYQEAFNGAAKRLPYRKTFMKQLSFLMPENAFNTVKRDEDIKIIAEKFKSKVNVEETIQEWCAMRLEFDEKSLEDMQKLEVCEFWEAIGKAKDCNGRQKFKNIFTLSQICLSLPHSNSEIETLFSLVSETKTKDRNCMKTDTVAALIRIRLDLRSTSKICSEYPITTEMLHLFDSKIYKRDSSSEPQSQAKRRQVTKPTKELTHIVIKNEITECDDGIEM